MSKRTITETRFYPFFFIEEKEAGVSALCQFGGTQGATMQEAFVMAEQLLVDLAAGGEPLDPPMTPSELQEEYDGDFDNDVTPTLTLVPYKLTTAAERINLTFPSDVAAMLKGVRNTSQYVTDLVRKDLGGVERAAKS